MRNITIPIGTHGNTETVKASIINGMFAVHETKSWYFPAYTVTHVLTGHAIFMAIPDKKTAIRAAKKMNPEYFNHSIWSTENSKAVIAHLKEIFGEDKCVEWWGNRNSRNATKRYIDKINKLGFNVLEAS